MKKMTFLLSLAMTGWLLLAPAHPAFAEDMPKHSHSENPGMMTWDAKSMQKELDLTDDQVTKLNAAMDEQKKTMMEMADQQRMLLAKLQEQVKAKASDADLTSTMDALEAGRKSMIEAGDKFKAQKDAILNPMQRAKMTLLHRPMGGPGMMHGGGHPMNSAPASTPAKP